MAKYYHIIPFNSKDWNPFLNMVVNDKRSHQNQITRTKRPIHIYLNKKQIWNQESYGKHLLPTKLAVSRISATRYVCLFYFAWGYEGKCGGSHDISSWRFDAFSTKHQPMAER